ncbi:MAG: hypothetical protein Q9200_006504 [Gallowayella weberi]
MSSETSPNKDGTQDSNDQQEQPMVIDSSTPVETPNKDGTQDSKGQQKKDAKGMVIDSSTSEDTTPSKEGNRNLENREEVTKAAQIQHLKYMLLDNHESTKPYWPPRPSVSHSSAGQQKVIHSSISQETTTSKEGSREFEGQDEASKAWKTDYADDILLEHTESIPPPQNPRHAESHAGGSHTENPKGLNSSTEQR